MLLLLLAMPVYRFRLMPASLMVVIRTISLPPTIAAHFLASALLILSSSSAAAGAYFQSSVAPDAKAPAAAMPLMPEISAAFGDFKERLLLLISIWRGCMSVFPGSLISCLLAASCPAGPISGAPCRFRANTGRFRRPARFGDVDDFVSSLAAEFIRRAVFSERFNDNGRQAHSRATAR